MGFYREIEKKGLKKIRAERIIKEKMKALEDSGVPIKIELNKELTAKFIKHAVKIMVVFMCLAGTAIAYDCNENRQDYEIIWTDEESGHMIIELGNYLGSGTDSACYEASQVFIKLLSLSNVKSLEIWSKTGFVPSKYNPLSKTMMLQLFGDEIHEYDMDRSKEWKSNQDIDP